MAQRGGEILPVYAQIGLLACLDDWSVSPTDPGLDTLHAGVACCYTGNLLRKCVDCKPGCKSYPEIGLHAFGQNGRKLVAFLLYLELFGCAVTFLLLPADNLAAIFPSFRLYCFGACKSLTTTQVGAEGMNDIVK